MNFASKLFTLSFTISLFIAFLGWKPWSVMWMPGATFLALAILTWAMDLGIEEARLRREEGVRLAIVRMDIDKEDG